MEGLNEINYAFSSCLAWLIPAHLYIYIEAIAIGLDVQRRKWVDAYCKNVSSYGPIPSGDLNNIIRTMN